MLCILGKVCAHCYRACMKEPALSFVTTQPENWPRPKGYSNGIRVPAGRDMLFLAGQIGWDAAEQMVGDTFLPQFRQALENIATLVKLAGGEVEDIVRLTVFCLDTDDYLVDPKAVGQAYRSVMGRHYPVMSLVQVAGLVETGALLEIEATAALLPLDQGDS
ncbi:MAG: enamine deaminase RidA (YjgF/YER057c/UK114 family) [Pseudohongiellaceae bacterium]|jgi:enamine deaminase RidA (YjgF/YER057c/UK114 family)